MEDAILNIFSTFSIKKVLMLDRVLRTVFPGLLLLTVIFSGCQEPGGTKPASPDTTGHDFTWEMDTIGDWGS